MKWIIKALVQKTISYLPFGQRVNYFFQKYITKGVLLSDDYLVQRLEQAKNHLDAYRELTGKSSVSCSLELGTGWYPVVPVCMFLAGANEIYSTDITALTKKQHLIATLEKLNEYINKGSLSAYISALPERVKTLQSILLEKESISEEEIKKQLRMHLIVQDARKLNFTDGYFDLIHSNNTFEHIYPHLLIPILKEFKRLCKRGGVMSHFIDMSDHFAHFDKSITIYHFLKFSEKQWKRIDNSIQPQSRLRKKQYEDIYQSLSLPYRIAHLRPGNITELRKIKPHELFSNLPEAELAISHCSFVSLME